MYILHTMYAYLYIHDTWYIICNHIHITYIIHTYNMQTIYIHIYIHVYFVSLDFPQFQKLSLFLSFYLYLTNCVFINNLSLTSLSLLCFIYFAIDIFHFSKNMFFHFLKCKLKRQIVREREKEYFPFAHLVPDSICISHMAGWQGCIQLNEHLLPSRIHEHKAESNAHQLGLQPALWYWIQALPLQALPIIPQCPPTSYCSFHLGYFSVEAYLISFTQFSLSKLSFGTSNCFHVFLKIIDFPENSHFKTLV